MDIEAWLKHLKLDQYAGSFAEHHIDPETLVMLTGADLKEIGVTSVGHRRKLLAAISKLGGNTVTATSEAAENAPVAERRQLTVMFCDLVGSTAIADELDPEAMRDVIRSYQELVSGEIARFDGYVARFMGDGVLAYFGWPRAHEDDAERAVRSGLAIAGVIGRLETPVGERLQARVGIATGLVVVGDLIGEGAAEEEAVMGSTPNLAARLQNVATANAVVISDSTRMLLGERFAYEDLGLQELRGFSETVQAWRVVHPVETKSRFEAARGPRLTPLVGRGEEMDLLLRRWAMAKAGQGQVVLLTGEAGIGKSRTAHALRERIAEDPHAELLYQCSPYHTNSALHPFIQQLERAADLEPKDTDAQKLEKLEALLAQSTDQLPRAASLIAQLLSIDSGTRYPALTISPEMQKKETLYVLLAQLEGLAARQPVLLVFEDLHWLDPTSQELLDLMVERVEGLPVLMTTTYRPQYVPAWAGLAHVSLLALKRLTQVLGAAMVRELSRHKDLPREVLDQIVNKSDGIPLFVEELTKAVLESGLLELDNDRYILAGSLPEHAIPTSLKDSLMARLDQLGPVKDVAQIGAAIGREFFYGLLADVSNLSDTELDAALDQLAQSELVFRRGTPPDATYAFKHALVQDAAYESLLKSRRQQLHAKIASALESRFPDRAELEPELLAHHYTAAGLTEQAVTYWRRAGERAAAQSAHKEAIEHFRRALELLKQVPNTTERHRKELAIQTALGPSLMVTKGWAAAVVGEAYSRALELCRQLGDEAELFPILRGLWEFYESSGDLQTATSLAEQLLSQAEQADSPARLIVAHDALADTLFWNGAFSCSQRHARQGLDLYDKQQYHDPAYRYGYDPGVACLVYDAWNSWFLGFPDQALLRAGQALSLARELSHPASLVVALTWLATLHQFRSNVPEARTFAEEVIAIANEQSFTSWLVMAATVNGWALAEQGRHEKGEDQLLESISLASDIGQLLWQPFQLFLLAEMRNNAGQGETAKQSLEEAYDIVNKTGERFWEAELHRLSGEILRSGPENDSAAAEECFDQALKIARRQQAKSLELRAATSLGSLWQNQGRRKKARDLLGPIYAWFTEGFETPDLIKASRLLKALS